MVSQASCIVLEGCLWVMHTVSYVHTYIVSQHFYFLFVLDCIYPWPSFSSTCGLIKWTEPGQLGDDRLGKHVSISCSCRPIKQRRCSHRLWVWGGSVLRERRVGSNNHHSTQSSRHHSYLIPGDSVLYTLLPSTQSPLFSSVCFIMLYDTQNSFLCNVIITIIIYLVIASTVQYRT